MTVLDDYLQHMERKGLRPRTVEKLLGVLALFVAHVAPRDVLTAVTADVESFVDCRRLVARTRYMYLSVIHTFFEWAVIYGRIDRDPTLRVVRPRLPRSVPHPIGDGDLRRVLDDAPPREAAMIALAAFHGLRAAEVAGVQRGDIIDTNTPPVLIVSCGKGGHQRVVPLHAAGWDLIRPITHGVRGWLFTDAAGSALPAWAVSHAVNNLLRSLGIDSTCHSLRHWYGTKVYQASHDLLVTQQLMGHASPLTTAGYVAFSSDDTHSAVASIGVPI